MPSVIWALRLPNLVALPPFLVPREEAGLWYRANEALVCPPERDRLGGPPELAREGREREWRVLFARHGERELWPIT